MTQARRDWGGRYWAAMLLPPAILAAIGRVTRKQDAESVEAGTVEVGVIGGDLPYWRAKQAVRIAEAKLSSQVQARLALEARAISLIGWSVTGFLPWALRWPGGTHVVAAGISAICLFVAPGVAAWSLLRRGFHTGFPPVFLPENRSASEYEILVSMAEGYQDAVEENARRPDRSDWLLVAAIFLLVLAPLAGLTTSVLLPDKPRPPDLRVTPVRGASAWGVCHGAIGFRECGPCPSPGHNGSAA